MSKWQVSTLGEVADFVLGKMLDQVKNKGQLRPYLANINVRWGEFDLNNLREMRFEPHEMARYSLRYGDIVMCEGGEPGRCAIWKQKGQGLMFQKALHRIRPHDCLDSSYLYYFFLNLRKSDGFSSYFTGATIKHLPREQLAKVEVRFPDISKQKAVAAILSAYDDLIANNQRRIALLERMAEDIYREWFVRLRFPGHAQVKIEKGVPQEWALVKLEKAFKFYGGATPARDTSRYWQNGTVNWFTPTDITGAEGLFLGTSGEQCTEEGLESCSANLFPAYCVMMTSRATIGAIGINLTPACTNQGFITCVPNETYPLAYLYHWLKLGKPHFESLSGGATFAELTKGTFKRMEILTPPQALVQQFQQLVAPLFKTMETHLKANASLKATRDALLPRLISGKLAVDGLDIRLPPGMAAG